MSQVAELLELGRAMFFDLAADEETVDSDEREDSPGGGWGDTEETFDKVHVVVEGFPGHPETLAHLC